MRIDGKHFSRDFTNGSFEIESLCFLKASSNLQGSIRILRAGLYYQNDIESIHAPEKCYQNFKKEIIEVALRNTQKIIHRVENDEIRALSGSGDYCLSLKYRKFQVASHVYYSWSEELKANHLRNFREYIPNTSDTFRMPPNAGRKPGYQHRDRNTTEPDIVVDRIEESATDIKPALYNIIYNFIQYPRATAEK